MRRSRLSLACFFAAAAATTGCSGSNSPAEPPVVSPEPPAGTGTVAIEMNGTWAIADLARVGSNEPLPNAGTDPFLGIHVGQMVRVAGDRLVDESGEPLFDPGELRTGENYVNYATGRLLVFESQRSIETGCVPLHVSVSALFGSVDDGEMRGEVQVLHFGGCPITGGLILPPIDGAYAVRLVRVFD
jgi:hypothetical protein